ncbi:proteasomal ATPase-associated factor 1-like [Glandiceps talaboti]
MAARLSIQCDWNETLREAEGQAWISCHKIGHPSIHGELKSHGTDSNNIPDIIASEGFVVDDINQRSLVMSYPEEDVSSKFISPLSTLSTVHNKSVVSIDVSSGGALGVSAGTDGQLSIWETRDGSVRRELKGHLGEVNCCQFFPSGMVVLSGSTDMQLRIWSVENGSCPVTLKGHKGGITDTAIVDKGRNVVSCSRDGAAKLWDCGQATCLGTLVQCDCPINGCDVGVANNSVNLGSPQHTPSEREIGTEGKLLLVAREDNILQGIGLHSRESIFKMSASAAFNCCAVLSTTHVIGGTQDGSIYILDIRNTSEPFKIIQRSKSPVLHLKSHHNGFVASTGDGSCYYMNPDSNYTDEYTGSDFDAIYGFAIHEDTGILYTACRDGCIRKYSMG